MGGYLPAIIAGLKARHPPLGKPFTISKYQTVCQSVIIVISGCGHISFGILFASARYVPETVCSRWHGMCWCNICAMRGHTYMARFLSSARRVPAEVGRHIENELHYR